MASLDLGIFSRSKVRHVRQSEVAECGLACIAMIANFYGLAIDLNTLRRQHAVSPRGTTLKGLIGIADRLNMSARPVRLPLEALGKLKLPAVLHWDLNHYVVLERIEHGKGLILDPASGQSRRIPMVEISRHFTGIALELQPTAAFEIADRRQRLRLTQLWGKLNGWKRSAVQALALTIFLQTFTLVSPYYLQIAIDSAVPAMDSDLLAVVACGFLIFSLFNAAATLLRGFVLLSAGATMGHAIAVNLGRHLFRLPVTWFERRHVGDVLSRFQSIRPIQDALAQGLVASVVDGLLAVLIFVLMMWYSISLAGIALIAFGLYAGVRIVSFGMEREAREAAIISSAREQSTLIEMVRGIITLRLFGREAERGAMWQNRLTDATNASLATSRVGVWQSSANTLLFGVENVITVWVAIHFVIIGGFSIGMVVAYLAYKQQFLNRMASLIDQGIAFRMLRLHVDRLADIALAKEDHGHGEPERRSDGFSGHLRLHKLSYRYAENEPLIFKGIDLDVPAGAHIALTGPSGAGKSTMAKIILGLVEPESGEVLVDGIPLRRFGYRNYRSQIATVLQEDHLFAGTIADNIALFDDDPDHHRIHEVSQLSAIHGEIIAMPMRYETLVGDMGSTLSGGQKARILLARALYRRPSLLLLDEGTAHLDAETESVVNRSIAALGITRIVIAHRVETIRAADQVWLLKDGELRRINDAA